MIENPPQLPQAKNGEQSPVHSPLFFSVFTEAVQSSPAQQGIVAQSKT
ncbi:MAG: hypothetical protein ABJB86_12175 [Bacteroidota bacterium]